MRKKERGYGTKFFVLGILVIVLVILIVVASSRDCKDDRGCFLKAAEKCSKAELSTIENGNNYEYVIHGKRNDNCVVTIHLVSLDSDNVLLKKALETKGMTCDVPFDKMNEDILFDLTAMNEYCTGPLKERLLQITVEKLYELIVVNFGADAIKISEEATPYLVS